MLEEVEKKIQKVESVETDHLNDQSIAQILSSLSHELRTPLSILSSNLQLLKRNDKLEEDIRIETFQLFEEALASVTRFLDQIYFLNLSNKGELRKKSRIFDVEEFLDKILNKPNSLYYKSKRLSLETNFLTKQFCSDDILLTHIITGLLDNAFKFSTKEVTVRISTDDQFMNILVEDEGIGINEDEVDSLFNPFIRGKNVKMISGSGLGLAIIKRSIDCLDGVISVESIVSRGTKFKLKIPADDC